MERALKRLAAETFDVLILGGGVNGLAAAWDATLRGFRVAVIDKGDFGGATSANSLKIIHGGLRYLQQLDLVRMRMSIRERSRLMRILPHLIRPLPFLVPAYGHGTKGREALALAAWINDAVSADRNDFLLPLGRELPNARVLGRRACLDLVPGLPPAGLTGGVVFYDGQMLNADRVTLSFALSAAARGAALGNYLEATGFIREGPRIAGVTARDRESGSEFAIRARITLNMTGPWAARLLRTLDGDRGAPPPPLSKGIQVITRPLSGDVGLAVASRHRDPAARLSRGARHYFITPWREQCIIGTTDSLWTESPDAFAITEAEIASFVREINDALPAARLSPDEVVHAFGGLQPVDPRRIGQGAQVAKHPQFIDHQRTDRVAGLLTVVGVKYTTCRRLAEDTIDRVCRRLGYQRSPCQTHRTPLLGGQIKGVDAFLDDAARKAPPGLSPAAARHLAATHGTQMTRITNLIQRDPALGATLPDSETVTRAEVLHVVRSEAVVHLDDVILRRTDLGALGYPGDRLVRSCAGLVADELHWSPHRREREVERTIAAFPLMNLFT